MLRGLTNKLKVLIVAQGLYNIPFSFCSQYNMLFAQALGASGSNIGLITAISALAMLIVSPLLGLTLERHSLKKIMILGLVCDTFALAIFALAGKWWMLIPGFILYGQLIRQVSIMDIFLITVTEPDRRGTLMGVSRVTWGVTGISASLIAAAVVTYFGGINAQGIRSLYYISIILLLFITIMVFFGLDETGLSNNRKNETLEEESGVREYLKFFRGEKHLKHWIVIRLCRDGFMSLQAIFVPLWMVNFKGADAAMLGVLSTLSAISSILMHIPAGKLADKIGRKKTFFLFSSLYCLGIITLILAPSFEFLVLAYILGWGMGGMGGVALTILMTMWWEGIPTENRGKLYGVEGIISASSRIPITAVGGILWDKGLQTMVLTLPVLAELFIVIPVMYTVPETFKNKNDLSVGGSRI